LTIDLLTSATGQWQHGEQSCCFISHATTLGHISTPVSNAVPRPKKHASGCDIAMTFHATKIPHGSHSAWHKRA
jgi:hypothetical protein